MIQFLTLQIGHTKSKIIEIDIVKICGGTNHKHSFNFFFLIHKELDEKQCWLMNIEYSLYLSF